MSFTKEFKLLLKARYYILYIVTNEEERLQYAIKSCIKDQSKTIINTYVWDFIDGYKGNPNDTGFGSRNPLQALEFIEKTTPDIPAIFILKDFHLFLNDLSITRKIKNISKLIRNQLKTIIIISSELSIPETLKDIITTLEFKLPEPSEIKAELIRIQNSLGKLLPDSSLETLVRSCQGLSIERIRKTISRVISTYKEINVESFDIIFTEKKQTIRQTKILEFCASSKKMSDIGGLENLKSWLKKRIGSLSQRAEKYGLPPPRGLFLVGIQGTGKSLVAKVIANEWSLPLLKLDVGKLFGGIIGESESRIRQMTQLAEAMSPCILWIDEIDKAFGGTGNRGDSGTTNRVLATFITWLSEKRSAVFVIATANSVQSLPSEIIRKGRFDEIFFVNLPNEEERKLIFNVHLKRLRPKSWKDYDITTLSSLTKKFSGAEIEEAINEAMFTAFNENREFTSKDIKNSIKQLIPLAISNQEQIDQLQAWALNGRARLSSSPDIKT